MFRLNPINVVLHHIYLLQLEEYDLWRYLQLMGKTSGLPKTHRRKSITTTPKLLLISLFALLLQATLCYGAANYLKSLFPDVIFIFPTVFLILFVVMCYMFYIFLTVSVGLTLPLDLFLKYRLVSQAKKKLAHYPHLKIIGIAGSYGKTTMKEVLASILSEKYTVLKTPKNINTPLGISRLILKHLKRETDILLIEMGEYYKGDIKQICELTRPDIGIITGINEAHLERLGKLENTVATIFELAQHMKSTGTLALNADDPIIMNNYHTYLHTQNALFYSARNHLQGDYRLSNVKFHEDASGISFDLHQKDLLLGTFKTAILGNYIVGDAIGAIQIAQQLGVSVNHIHDGLLKMKPVEHRLQPIFNPHTKVLVIDDSYNGNPAGVQEAIGVLAQFKQQRKIYLTPGLVEAGERTQAIHYNIGKQLAPVAGLVLLIRNSVTPFIEKGLLENGFNKENIIWFDTVQEAHKSLGKILRPYDVILFQNDWPDNYL